MQKIVAIDGIGQITLSRRKGTRRLKLSISGSDVRLSVPFGVSEGHAITFLRDKAPWIAKHRTEAVLFRSGDRIGRAHQLVFQPTSSSTITTTSKLSLLTVHLPQTTMAHHVQAQTAAKRVAKKSLLAEAKSLLPQRLEQIARKTGLSYKSVSVRFLKSRWGSCSNHNDIALSAYLIQLPWPIIDYVLLHELCHTIEHNHSTAFWRLAEAHQPTTQQLRKQLKAYQTDVLPNSLA